MASLVAVLERAFSARSSTDNSPSATTKTAASEAVVWTLRVVVALQCLGAAWAQSLHMTPIGETLFFDLGISEQAALFVEQLGLWLMVGSAAAVMAFRSRAVPALVTVWFMLLAAFHTYRGGAAFTDWALGAHAVRYVAPAALAIMIRPFDDERGMNLGEALNWLLRGAAAATFLIHGLEALNQHPRFVDYLLVASNSLLGYDLAEPVARNLLYAIGTMDVTLAVLVLAKRKWRWVLLWMAFWGVVTACSRIVFGGWDKGYMALERAANGGIPLALFVWQTARLRASANP